MFRKPKTPETIATEFGWANPKTGEVLVSIRGLPNPVKGFVSGRPYTAAVEPIITDPVPEVNTETGEPEETAESTLVKKVVSRRRK